MTVGPDKDEDREGESGRKREQSDEDDPCHKQAKTK